MPTVPQPFKNSPVTVSKVASICHCVEGEVVDAFGTPPYTAYDLVRVAYEVLSNTYEDESSINPLEIYESAERLAYLRGEVIIEDILSKRRKNRRDSGELLDANTVELALATTFKSLSTFLETLPDQLERKGLIKTEDIQAVIDVVDNMRKGMADDMKKVSG